MIRCEHCGAYLLRDSVKVPWVDRVQLYMEEYKEKTPIEKHARLSGRSQLRLRLIAEEWGLETVAALHLALFNEDIKKFRNVGRLTIGELYLWALSVPNGRLSKYYPIIKGGR